MTAYRYEWEIQGDYGQGWETVTTESYWLDAKAQLATYRAEEPDYPHRARRVRVEQPGEA